MKGFYDLKSPADLLAKLHREHARLKNDPTDVDTAWNLFVTAEHMLDWHIPNLPNRKRGSDRKALVDANPILQICSHIANGAKHFEALARHHDSVAGTERTGGYFSSDYFGAGYFAAGYWGTDSLIVKLDGSARAHLGDSISVADLADRVVQFWSSYQPTSSP